MTLRETLEINYGEYISFMGLSWGAKNIPLTYSYFKERI